MDIHKNDPKLAFVKGVIESARKVNASILAEGVELWEEAEILRDLGADYIQGYLLHKPQKIEDILSDIGCDEKDYKDELGTVA